MPKARLSNDKGLVQSSGNGLQLTPANANGAGLHFKTIRVELLSLTSSNVDNAIVTTVGTLPAQSAVLGISAVCDELSSGPDVHTFSLSHAAAGGVIGHASGGTDLIASVNTGKAGSDTILNLGSGSFLDVAKAIGTNTTLYLLEDGLIGQDTFQSGSLVFNIAYAGVES